MDNSTADSAAGRSLLVSTCNVAANPQPTCLFRLDLDTFERSWVDVGLSEHRLVTGTGLFADEDFIYHVSVIEAGLVSHLSILDRHDQSVVAVGAIPEARDPHSVCRRGDELIVASSETDEIIAYRISGTTVTAPRVVWTPTGSGRDTHHVNSVAIVDGELWCTAFGPADPGSTWRTSSNGYAMNVDRGEMLLDGLQQPHTVARHNGATYFCNSRVGTVNSDRGPLAQLAGYTRGLAFTDQATYVGTSYARRSKTAGDVFLNPTDQGAMHGQCSVVRLPAALPPRSRS